jgi:hypothetical protein
MSRQSQPLLALALTATGAIAVHRFVGPGVTQAAAAAGTWGVARMPAATGDTITVDALGTAVVETGGAIADGALIETDADGRAVSKTSGPAVARALPGQAATAAGQFIEVLLLPN